MKNTTKKILAGMLIGIGVIMMPTPIVPGILIVALGYALWRDADDIQKERNKRK
jgi:uncharacterized protein YqgC (DUF456 family)